MKLDNRVFFDTEDGKLLFWTGEAEGDGLVPHKENLTVGYIDIPHGSIDYRTTLITGVNPETLEPITETIDNLTEDQRRIKQLEEEAANLMVELALTKAGV